MNNFQQTNFVNFSTYNNNSASENISMTPIVSADTKFAQTVNGIAYCYVMPTIAVVGILGNIANLMTLANPKLKAVSYMYLRALGIADLLCMCFVLVFVFFEILKLYHNETIVGDYAAVWYRAHLMLPLINASVSAGILTVVALTVERYISICFPTFFRSWNVPSRATMLIFCAYVIPFVLYIPMCWQMEIVPMKYEYDATKNLSTSNSAVGDVTNTSGMRGVILWKERYPEIPGPGHLAYKWTRETLLKFIPIVSLTILNLQIILTFREVRKRRQRMMSSANQNIREQRSLLILLAGIAILFFICNIPAAINLVFISDENKKLHVYMIFRAMANLMEIINHALNFYVFCLCSADYRQTFLHTFPVVKNFRQKTSKWYRQVGGWGKEESNAMKKSLKTAPNNRTTSTVILNDGQKSGRQKQHHNNGLVPAAKTQQVTNGGQAVQKNHETSKVADVDVRRDNTVWQDANKLTVVGGCLVLSNDKIANDLSAGDSRLDGVHYIDDYVTYDEASATNARRPSGGPKMISNKNNNTDGGSGQHQQHAKQTTMVIMNYCLDDEGADDVLL